MFNTVTIIGVGLIGGSLGLEIRRKKLARHVIGCGRTRKNLLIAKKRGLIDEIASHVPAAAASADLIILSGPVMTICRHLKAIGEYARPGTLVMDVGSTKGMIVREAKRLLPPFIHFVGAHPLAGTERGGAKASKRDLFLGKKCLLTPVKGTSRWGMAQAKKFWGRMGSNVILYDAKKHDERLAITSHLPHLAAYALMRTVGKSLSIKEIRKLSGGGLLDTTRISASPPEMWTDISLSNTKAIGRLLNLFRLELDQVTRLVRQKNRRRLLGYFKRGAQLRRQLPSASA